MASRPKLRPCDEPPVTICWRHRALCWSCYSSCALFSLRGLRRRIPLTSICRLAADGSVCRALVRHGRTGPRRPVAMIYGARISMLVGSCVVAASLTLGLIFGSIAGYYGGVTDRFLNVVVMNAFMSFPRNSAGDCLRRVPGPGNFQSDLRAFSWRMGGLRAAGAGAGSGRARARIRRGRPRTWRQRILASLSGTSCRTSFSR